MDSLTNSYSIYFPSGLPSVTFPLPLFFSALSFTPTQLPSAPASPTTLSHLFSPHVLFFFFTVPCYPHLQSRTLVPPHSQFMSWLLFFSPHPVWSGSQRSVWSAEHSCWTPAGWRCQQPLRGHLVRGTPPWQSAGPVCSDRMQI